MPPLRNPKREAFAQCLARGLPVAAAYAEAGYTPDSGNAYALKRQPDIQRRLGELTEKKAQASERADREVLGRLAQTKEALARALGPSVFCNIADFMTIGPDGLPRPDFSRCTYDQMAAIKSITIEEFIDKGSLYYDETLKKMMPREVRRMTFTMRDNVPSAVLMARLFKWIEQAPKGEPPTSLEQRLRAMTPEQRRQDAKELHERIRERLKELPPSAVEPEAENLETNTEKIQGGIGEEEEGR
jgi:hypothetical protein